MKTKAREFHGHDALLAGHESPCRDNTIEGNVGVRLSRFLRLSWDDNGEARAEGQPPPRAFPKAFIAAFMRLLRSLYPKVFYGVFCGIGDAKRERISSSAAD
ncbi:MAG TPA: hypothetical protein VGD75_01905 [Bradyrhizobium sp.]